MSSEQVKRVVEAALLAAGRPLTVDKIQELFEEQRDAPERADIHEAISALQLDWEGRSIQIVEVASGYRAQIREAFSDQLGRLWAERPGRYSRALLETLALIAYRQPITRGEIEDVRGVAVSTSIIKTLLERDWIREVGHREVPGRPALFATTRQFLDSFSLKDLDELPPLADLRDLDSLPGDLFAEVPVVEVSGAETEQVTPTMELTEEARLVAAAAQEELAADEEHEQAQPASLEQQRPDLSSREDEELGL